MRAPRHALAAACILAPLGAAAQNLDMQPGITALGEAAPQSTVVTLILDAPAQASFIAMVETVGATARAGSDFVPVSQPVSFTPGQVVGQVTVTALNDPEDEPETEMFQLQISDIRILDPQAGAVVTPVKPLVAFTIRDDDHTLSVATRDAREGGSAALEVTQKFDSRETVNVFAMLEGGTATPGVDFDPSQPIGYLPEGRTRLTLDIPTLPDDEKEPAETVRYRVQAANPGTVVVTPAVATVSIQDATPDQDRPATLKYGPGTGYAYHEGELVHSQEFPVQTFRIRQRMHVGGSGFTLSQGGTDLPFRRVCAEEIDAAAAAQSIPGMSAAEMRGAGDQAWRAGYTVDGVPFDYVLFGDPDERMTGYAHSEYVLEGQMAHNQYFAYVVTPEVADPAPDMPRPAPEATPVVDPGAAESAVARAIAADLGLSPAAVAPYLTTSLAGGSGNSPVEVRLFLDPDGRPVEPARSEPDPCDPGYGKMQPAVTRLIYKVHAFEDRFVVQSKTQDVETGRYDSAFMEDLGSVTNSLDTAVERAHDGLSPDLAPPAD